MGSTDLPLTRPAAQGTLSLKGRGARWPELALSMRRGAGAPLPLRERVARPQAETGEGQFR